MKDVDGSPTAELFLDGVSVGTDSTTSISRAGFDTNFRIGRSGVADREMTGDIAQVRIYTRALSPPQIWEIHQDPLGIVRPKQRVVYPAPAAGPGWGGLLSHQRNRLTYVS